MYWNWDTSVPYIFFKWWTAETPLGMLAAVLMVFVLAFFYENIISLRARYDASLIRNQQASLPLQAKPSCGDCCQCSTPANMTQPFTTTQALIRSALFAFSNFYSLFLMMVFMTYNAYLCIALVAGAGSGHFWSSVFLPEADPLNRPRSCCG
jgi:copper transporter 1